MRVKICGIMNTADALAAVEAGADAIGLNFVGGPRRIELATAREIVHTLPPMVTPVALIRLEQGRIPGDSGEFLTACRVSHLQIYGETDPTTLAALVAAGFRPMPVVAVKDAGFAEQLDRWGDGGIDGPVAVVLDAYAPGQEGGTGRSFNWEWVAALGRPGSPRRPPIILAGGLTPENVAAAIRIARPYGVDVSSGVEVEGSPGRKDREKLLAFVRNARQAAHSHVD